MDNKKLLYRGLISISILIIAIFLLTIVNLYSNSLTTVYEFIIIITTIAAIFLTLKSVIKDYWDNEK